MTTAPAPIRAKRPIRTPGKTIAPAPIDAPMFVAGNDGGQNKKKKDDQKKEEDYVLKDKAESLIGQFA